MVKGIGYIKKGSLSSSLERAIVQIFKTNLAIKKNEKVLIVIDKNKKKLGELFLTVGKKFSNNICIVKIPIGKVNGEEPPAEIAKKMLDYDVEILITTKSLTHTNARKNACKKGARIATLPNITEDILKRVIDVDYKKMHKAIGKIANVLNKEKEVRIVSEKGTDLSFSIKGRKAHGRESSIITKKGSFGNLPDGECFIAPVEKSANGIYVVDGSIGGIGKVDKPVKVIVKDGYATDITGGKAAKKLNGLLKRSGKAARNIAEFGIGANDKAKITGNMLEDEKAIGTCHIALGNNSGFGGKIEVPLHIDGLIKKPSIFVGNKKIMKNGRLIL